MRYAHKTEIAVYVGAPVTFVGGVSAAVFLTTPYALLPGSAVALLSAVAFGMVHCIRVNRHRRQQHKPEEIC